MNKTVLITGAYGFIGRYVALEYSKQGYYVIGVGHSSWDGDEYIKWGIKEFYNIDINIDNLKKIKSKINIIVHCAGGASVSFSFKKPIEDFKKTVNTTINVLEFIKQHSHNTKFIYLSSAAVYGENHLKYLDEETILNPISPYGFHKKIAEEICQNYARQYSMNIIILRLFSVYGEELRKQLLWDACNKVESNQNIFLGTGDEIRDWLHVKDVARYICVAANYIDTNCNIYNVGSGKGETVRNILKILFSFFNLEEEPMFNNIIDKGNPNQYIANIEKIKNWHVHNHIEIKKGIENYVKWYKRKTNN